MSLMNLSGTTMHKNKFDSYDQNNDTTARFYLESTFDPSLLKELDHCQDPTSTAVTWMRILCLGISESVERFNQKCLKWKFTNTYIDSFSQSLNIYINTLSR